MAADHPGQTKVNDLDVTQRRTAGQQDVLRLGGRGRGGWKKKGAAVSVDCSWREFVKLLILFKIPLISRKQHIAPSLTLRSRWTTLFRWRKVTPSRICLISLLTSCSLKASSSDTHWLKISPPAALREKIHADVRNQSQMSSYIFAAGRRVFQSSTWSLCLHDAQKMQTASNTLVLPTSTKDIPALRAAKHGVTKKKNPISRLRNS